MERDTELLRCLALVRPIGMNDDMASDWLAAALFEVRNMSDGQFRSACQHARATCTHHGQIIPAIIKAAGEGAGMADRYIRDWSNALLDYQMGYTALPYKRDRQIGSQIAGYLENIKITDES